MTPSNITVSRAALDAARVVFGRVTEGAPGASVLEVRLASAWDAAEAVLHSLTGRPDLHGQALVSEARRIERLSLGEAHWLVDLLSAAERNRSADGTTVDAGTVTRNALRALESAVITSDPRPPALDPLSEPPPRIPISALPPKPGGSEIPGPRAPRAVPISDPVLREEIAAPSSHRRIFRSAGFILGAIVVLVLGSAGAWYATRTDAGSDFDTGVAAYQRGAREVARQAFATAARAEPNDERPLIFLGRLAREEGNLPTARRFLDAAIRIAPSSALANRELASVLLADGNAELARRFYVRALQLDPTDRLAQGFLGCALFRLGRPDEAKRWTDRAGPGDWEPCVNATVPAPPTIPSTAPTTPARP